MYIAELKGKLSEKGKNKEDVLTSNVFSFFKYADRKIFLRPFLDELNLDLTISVQDVDNAKFQFWPTFDDGTEPDVIVIVGSYYVLFEAKYKSDFGKETEFNKDQLTRELKEGKIEADKRNKEFRFVAITADYNKPKNKFQLLERSCTFSWINWHFVSLFLEKNIEKSTEDCLIAMDLYELLKKKGLRKFNGFQEITLDHKIFQSRYIYFDYRSARYRGKFIGFNDSFKEWQSNLEEKEEYIFWEKYNE